MAKHSSAERRQEHEQRIQARKEKYLESHAFMPHYPTSRPYFKNVGYNRAVQLMALAGGTLAILFLLLLFQVLYKRQTSLAQNRLGPVSPTGMLVM